MLSKLYFNNSVNHMFLCATVKLLFALSHFVLYRESQPQMGSLNPAGCLADTSARQLYVGHVLCMVETCC